MNIDGRTENEEYEIQSLINVSPHPLIEFQFEFIHFLRFVSPHPLINVSPRPLINVSPHPNPVETRN